MAAIIQLLPRYERMTEPSKQPGPQGERPKPADKKARLSEALRKNLLRRKAATGKPAPKA